MATNMLVGALIHYRKLIAVAGFSGPQCIISTDLPLCNKKSKKTGKPMRIWVQTILLTSTKWSELALVQHGY
jgi:hypothetical protein